MAYMGHGRDVERERAGTALPGDPGEIEIMNSHLPEGEQLEAAGLEAAHGRRRLAQASKRAITGRLAACVVLSSTLVGVPRIGAGGTASASSSVLMFYAIGTEPQTTTPSGRVLGGNGRQVVGDYLIDTYELYLGTEERHARTWTSTVSLHCLITSLSKPNLAGSCETVLASGGSMLVAYGPETFQSGPSHTYRAPIVFGTGTWRGAGGELIGHDIGLGNDAEFSVYLSRG